jgi:hypothetical protein
MCVPTNVQFIFLRETSSLVLVNDQLDALFLNVFISCLCLFRATSAHHQEDQLVPMHHASQEETSTSFLLTGTSDGHPPGCIIPDDVLSQVGPPDEEHLLLETCRGMK